MKVKCINVEGFEDQLTLCKVYEAEGKGKNSFIIVNDNHEPRWYGTPQLEVVYTND